MEASDIDGAEPETISDFKDLFKSSEKVIEDLVDIENELKKIESEKTKTKLGKIRMVIAWNPKANYKARFPFKRIVETTIKTNFRKRFNFELREALKTAR